MISKSESTVEQHRHSLISDLLEIAHDLWHYRELLYQLTLRDIRLRYKQAVMGFAWAAFMPAVIILSGIVVKYAMAYVAGTNLETGSIAGMAVKALPWAFFIGSISFATTSLTSNSTLVTKIYFPREVFPLSATLAQGFDTSISMLCLLPVLPLLGIKFSLAILWVPILVVLLFVFTVAVAFFLSCANLFFRDVKYIVQVILMFGIFFTPVFFEPSMFGPQGSFLMMLNPLAPLLEGLRLSVVEGHNLLEPLVIMSATGHAIYLWAPWYLLYSAVWGVGGLLGSSLMFHRLQFLFAEYI